MMKKDPRTQHAFQLKVEKSYLPFIMEVLRRKGSQYSGLDKPALINFDEEAEETEKSPESVLFGLAGKHWRALRLWAEAADNESWSLHFPSDVTERIVDVIVYMLLLLYMLDGRLDGKRGIE